MPYPAVLNTSQRQMMCDNQLAAQARVGRAAQAVGKASMPPALPLPRMDLCPFSHNTGS